MKAVPIWEITYRVFFGNCVMLVPAKRASEALEALEDFLTEKNSGLDVVSVTRLQHTKFLAPGEEKGDDKSAG